MNVPKLRFPGFDREWQQDSLGNLTTSYSGGTPKSSNKSYYTGNIPFIRSGEINSSTTELFINEEGLNSSSAKMVDKGDILYALYGATSGEVGISRINGAINQAILCIKPLEQLNKLYLKDFLEGYKSKIISTYLQGGQGNLSGNIIKEISIPFPSLKEQEKLALFFDTFTRKIQLQQEKIDLLKERKNAFLQKMFPRSGDSQPEMRFNGFSGDWRMCNVSEITKFHKQGFYTKESYDSNKKYYLLRGTEMTSNKLILNETPKIDATEKDYNDFKVKKGDFLIVRSGTVGTYGIVYDDIEAIFGSYLINFRFDLTKVTNEFFGLFYQSQLFKNQLNKIIQKSSNININAENIKSTNIIFPSIEEQTRIGKFFGKLDGNIELQQKKLEFYKKQKQAFMQQMFI